MFGHECSAETQAHKFVQFIGLNPSTADETQDDPTIRRCIDFSKRWGYGAMCMTNLFAFRATDPEAMKQSEDPVGKDNDQWIFHIASEAGLVVAAWGNHGEFQNRGEVILNHLKNIQGVSRPHHLRLTNSGHPRHPLYLRKDLKPIPFQGLTVASL